MRSGSLGRLPDYPQLHRLTVAIQQSGVDWFPRRPTQTDRGGMPRPDQMSKNPLQNGHATFCFKEVKDGSTTTTTTPRSSILDRQCYCTIFPGFGICGF